MRDRPAGSAPSTGGHAGPPVGWRAGAAARAFLDEAAKEGIRPTAAVSGARTVLYCCGAGRRTSACSLCGA